ncbi:hypothetical protein KQI86_10560 [Clostridium sp. MSJ-11]|uniref:Uncharacterized protein n=1 Tax=Clostridium mobile TaxID=2841512 RepID=A0ABS6EHU2_9CLOT|nr:hypothetical protein [Clostridium mobile]MBU5484776.1 hypothetical protein [Clostridium mobile]
MFEDAVLVKDILNGEVDKFGDIVDKYEKIIFILIYNLIGNNYDAMKICKEVFILAYEDLYKYNFNCKFFNWILKITIDKCNFYSRNNEVKSINILSTLDCKDRYIVALKSLKKDLTYEDISEILDINKNNIKERYRKTVSIYKSALKEAAL